MHRFSLLLVLLLSACSKDSAAPTATTRPIPVAVGELAPDVSLVLHDGTSTKLSAQRGSQVLLFFYPKDDTAG